MKKYLLLLSLLGISNAYANQDSTTDSCELYATQQIELFTETCAGDTEGLMVYSRVARTACGQTTYSKWAAVKNTCTSKAQSRNMTEANINAKTQEWTKYGGGTAPTCSTQRMLDGACVSDCNSGPSKDYNACFQGCFFYVDSCSKKIK